MAHESDLGAPGKLASCKAKHVTLQDTLNNVGTAADDFIDKKLYTIHWEEKPKLPYATGFDNRGYQFTGTAEEVYIAIQWVKSKINAGDDIVHVEIHELIRDRKKAIKKGYHWCTVNGRPVFHSPKQCPDGIGKKKKGKK